MSKGPAVGDLVLRRYRLAEAHGETALWQGFLAQDEQQADAREPSVFLKLVRPELAHDEPSRAYLLRELARVRLLQHPGIQRPTEVLLLEDRGAAVLVEPIQAGLSQGLLLSRMVRFRRDEGDAFRLDEVRRIGVEIASALAYVHGQLLCHGDLRLESILLRPEGVRLCDVGLGRALPRGPYLDAVEKAGEAHLLAPEVRTGRPPDIRSDVFGLGALYRHLLSMGEPAAWEAFQREHPALASVILRALDNEPAQRHPAVEALVADLEAVALTGAPVRRRHSPTPVALAVAAGRLPVEELSRSFEGDPQRRPGSQREDAVVLAPLSTSPSARISRPPRASAPPKAQALGSDDDDQPTRSVRRSDAADPRARSREPEVSDVGSHYTVPVGRISEEQAASRPPLQRLSPEGDDVLDYTVEQVRPEPEGPEDPEDAPTRAVPRLDLPPDAAPDRHAPEAQPTVRKLDASVTAEQSAPDRPVVFRELPLLVPAPQRPEVEEAATGLYSPPPMRRTADRTKPAPAATERASPTPTRPTPTPLREGPPPISRLTIAGALLLAAVLGALGAVLIVSLLRPPPPRAVPAAAPVNAQPMPPQAPRPPVAKPVLLPPRPAQEAPAPSLNGQAPWEGAEARAAAAGASGPCPAGMVAVPAPRPFCIDQHEQPGVGKPPIAGLGYRDAQAICEKLGRRLCTDAEWELACRGKGRASYPYGHDVRDGLCNTRGGAVLAGGSRTSCVSASGAYDMSGNVAEWTQGGGLRGGSALGETDGRCSVRLKIPPGGKSPFTGVRCCR